MSSSGEESSGRLPPTARGVLLNFAWMSLCFSLNHGCVTSCLALASAQLGPTLGGYSSGILYVFYTLTALLVAPAVVQRLGAKGSLQGGLVLYCLYVASYALALFAPAYRWPAVLVGAALGGLAAGWLWTAQGGYFAASAELYAHVLQVAPEVATSYLSGVFATLYLGLELALKLISTAVLAPRRDGGDRSTLLFAIYTAIALLSTVGTCCIQPIAPHLPARADPAGPADDLAAAERPPAAADERSPRARGAAKALLAVDLMLRSRELWLLAPINTSFGFMASYLNFYVNGVLVKETLGASSIGLLTSVISGVATLVSPPLSWLASRVGKTAVIVLGALVFAGEALVLLAFSPAQLGHWRFLIPLYAAHGVGRAVWEGPNRALTADRFAADREGAFANLIMQNGLASAVGYFVFPWISPHAMASVCVANLALSIAGVLAASWPRAHGRPLGSLRALQESLLPDEHGAS